MRNGVELPLNWPQDVLMYAYPDEGGNVVQSVRVSDYIAALTRIATLDAQVEELNGNYTAMKEFEETWRERAECAEAELAALREGATVTWRVDRAMLGGVEQEWNNLSEFEARAIYDQVLKWPDNKSVTLRELITRERILDTTGDPK